MEKLNLILNENEKKSMQENNHDLHVKIFIEQIIPFIGNNPGVMQANFKKWLPNGGGNFYTKMSEFLYYLSQQNLVKRKKAGSTYKLFINSETYQIRDFLTSSEEKWKMKISYKPPSEINSVVYSNSNQLIRKYFGKNTIKIINKYSGSSNLSYLGGSLKFDVNGVLEQILEKYWTDECEKELENCLLKYGFFADDYFFRSKYKEIVGENKIHELFDELEHHASEIKISHCGWKTIKTYHIPILYINSFKFKWGLMPEIVEKKCQYCNDDFLPGLHLSSIIQELEKNFTINSLNEIDFCIKHALGQNLCEYDGLCEVTLPKDKMIQYIKDLINLINFIPPSSFKNDLSYLRYLDRESFIKAIKLLNDMPPYEKSYHTPYGYKEVFGSWFKALIAADVLENDLQKMNFGYKVLANDGHECLSLGEKNIDDWLYLNNIPHEKEPIYPIGNFRADWKVGKHFIEYWGLKGKEDYDNKILIKKEIAKEYNIPLIEIFPEDIPNLEMKLKTLKN